MTSATSDTSAKRRNGILDNISRVFVSSDHPNLPMSVIVTVGLTELHLTLYGPNSSAKILVTMSSAAFDAAYTM